MNTATAQTHTQAPAKAHTLDAITLGARDLERAKAFYSRGLGCTIEQDHGAFVMLRAGSIKTPLALYQWNGLADDAGVAPQTDGFRGATLNYIVDTADEVDLIIDQALRAGGSAAKPAKRSLWGYGGLVTDPSGHLWKVAASKGPPLFGRRVAARAGGLVDAGAVLKSETVLLGSRDIKRTRDFYAAGLGWPVDKDYGKYVSFGCPKDAAGLALYGREALAADADIPPAGNGFSGLILSTSVESAKAVDELLSRALAAGGRIAKPGQRAAWGGYSGHFNDPDGQLWKVASAA